MIIWYYTNKNSCQIKKRKESGYGMINSVKCFLKSYIFHSVKVPVFAQIINHNHLKINSMKKTFTILSLLIICSLAFAQVPLLVEDFTYMAGDAIKDHDWTAHSAASTSPILVTDPGLTFAGYVGSNIGLAAGLNNNGQDVNKTFTSQTSGSLYTSFLVNSTLNTGEGGYFFMYRDEEAGTAFRARTFIKPETGKMRIGFSFNASAYLDSIPTLLNFGETYLFVVKYTIVDGAENDNVSLYVFKAGDDFTTEPAVPTLGPLTATHTTPTDPLTPLGPDINANEIALRQFESAQKITVDGFRVKTAWDLTQDETAALTVSTNALAIAATADTTNSFDITSNTSWTAVSDQDWLTVSSGSGSGDATITVTATENLAAEPRTANVTVSAEGVADQIVIITQAVLPSLSVSTNTLTIAAAASSTNTFDITSNTGWIAVSDQDWLTLSSGSGSGDATLTLTASENPTSEIRTANVTVSAEGVTAQIVNVSQEGSPTTGINKISNKPFIAYPNPVSDGYLNFVDPVNSLKQVEIYNVVGKRVLIENTSLNSIDVKKLNAGVYILKVTSNYKTTSTRLIVK